MRFLRVTIDGNPIPKNRARARMMGKHVQIYDPQVSIKQDIAKEMITAFKKWTNSPRKEISIASSELLWADSYTVRIRFSFAPTQSQSATKCNQLEWGMVDHCRKPDLDNLAKLYLDAGNGVLWNDDRNIISLSLQKRFYHIAKTEIWVMANKKCSVQDEIQGILGILAPDDLFKFMELSNALFIMYDVDQDDDWMDRGQGEEDTRSIRLARTAYLLSQLADTYSNKFKAIHRAYPAFWERLEKKVQMEAIIDKETQDERRDE